MIASIYRYPDCKLIHQERHIIEFNQMHDVFNNGDNERLIVFLKQSSNDPSTYETIMELCLPQGKKQIDPHRIFIMENGKTVETIDYRVNDII